VSSYFIVKAVHIVSAAVLFGTGLGIAFFKWATDRTGNVAAILVVSEKVVLADWLFTLPAIVIQALTGVTLGRLLGYPMSHGWLAWSLRCSFWQGVAGFRLYGCRFGCAI
jgi:uncharacterized membrane protein